MTTLVMDTHQFSAALYRLNGCKSYAWNGDGSKNDAGVLKIWVPFGIRTPVNRKTPGQENQAGIFTIMMFLSSLRLFVVNGRNNRF